MATYINTSILLKPDEVFEDVTKLDASKFAWLLLGSPTEDVARDSNGTSENGSFYPLGGDKGTWKVVKGKMTFLNANVCGIAPVSSAPSYKQEGGTYEADDDGNTEVAESIVYSFPGNSAGENNLLYPMVPGGDIESAEGVASTQGYDINNGYLALVKLIGKSNNNFDTFKVFYQSLWTQKGDGSIGGSFSQMKEDEAKKDTIANDVQILVAYDVANPSMINQYNFTGFNVGSSSLTITGLSSGN